MENLFANVINEEAINNLTNEQVDELLEILKKVK
jgi:NADH:ubiquinone oxidoreductase subunit E